MLLTKKHFMKKKSTEEWKLYRFVMTWGWVNVKKNTIPLKAFLNFEQYISLVCLFPLNVQNEKHCPRSVYKKKKIKIHITVLFWITV